MNELASSEVLQQLDLRHEQLLAEIAAFQTRLEQALVQHSPRSAGCAGDEPSGKAFEAPGRRD